MITLQFTWLKEPRLIDIVVNGEEIPSNMLLCNLKGEIIPFTIMRTHSDDGLFHLEIEPIGPITLKQGCFILHRQKRYYLYPTVNFLNHFYHSQLPSGVVLKDNSAIFRLWSPTAQNVELTLYNRNKKYLYRLFLERKSGGMWEKVVHLDSLCLKEFHLLHYSYRVNSKQNWHRVIDPYALSLTPVTSSNEVPLGVVIDLNKIKVKAKKLKNSEIIKSDTEFIGYEAHVRDLSISSCSPVQKEHKGKYLGVSELSEYFRDLGITHLQLMPVQKMHTVNELIQEYQDESTPVEKQNYNWGYDPLHYCSLEGWYSQDPKNPVSRIEEFITMINQLHQHNIGVIIDVVYNHIYNENILELVAPGCYLRRKSWGDISHDTGAGATIESRINMVRELIIHSLKILQNYGVNGFRFDLLSFLDHKTIRTIRKELGDDTILYGEGWNFTDLPPEQAITKYHFPHEIKLGLFNDSARDAFIGHKLDHGIVQGNFTQNLKAKSALVAGSMLYQHDYNEDGRDDIILGHDPYNFFTRAPEECINFLDIHDGLTLWDKINLTVDGPLLKKEQFFKQALSLLLGSQGRIVLHGGVELQRSKPVYSHDKEKHRSFTTKCLLPETPGPFHENSYCSIDATNAIRWENRGSKIWEFTRQLIKLRRNVSQTHLNTIDEINQGFRFIERTPPPARHNIHNFNELPSLSIKFINGPKNEILYITGEVFPETDENPIDNPYKIVFDDKGTGKITFDKTDIQNFDLDQWGFDHDLQIKLIHTPGTWDYYKPSYSPLGYNLISLYTIDATYSVTIDLSIKDYHAILEFLQEPSLLVYTLAKPNSNPSLMIHNLSSNCREILVEAKKRTPEIINIFNDQKIPSPVEIKGHHSMIFQIDHPISELYIKILKENPCSME